MSQFPPDAATNAPLLPRYRRPLTFGGVLDETFQVWRRIWPTCALVLGLAEVLKVGVLFMLGGTTAVVRSYGAEVPDLDIFSLSAQARQSEPGLGFWQSLADSLLISVTGNTIIVLVDTALRGQHIAVDRAFLQALRRLFVVFSAGWLSAAALLGLAVVSIPLLLVSVGGVVPAVALVVWWRAPSKRAPWLKWLIILSTPFGLVVYLGCLWTLSDLPAVLEGAGPVATLKRSRDLVRGALFRTVGVVLVLYVIAFVLRGIPDGIVGAVQWFVARSLSDSDSLLPEWLVAGRLAAILVSTVVFGGIHDVGQTMLYHDLRNRKEGADLAEQVRGLEPPVVAIVP